MANIGTTTAFYKVETSLTRANNEVSKSMERLATGRQNANAGDRSSYVAMADTFRLDFVGTKAGIKGASVVMGYLETGMRVLDAASALLSRLQELAILGANDTNTTADAAAINAEAEAIGDEFNRLMSTSTYKGKNVFVTTAGSEYVSLGGRDAEMTFGIADITYTELYDTAATTAGTDTTTTKAGRVYKATEASVDFSAAGGPASSTLNGTFIATKASSGHTATELEDIYIEYMKTTYCPTLVGGIGGRVEKRYRRHSVPRVARSVRRLVAGCAAGCGVGNQAVLLSKCQSCPADLNAHSLCPHLKGHERSGSAPVSEPAPIDLLGPCAFR